MRSIANLARALEMSVGELLQQSGAPGAESAERLPPVGEILLVEDNPTDAALTLRAFKRAKFTNPVKVVTDGQAALDYLLRAGRYARREASLPLLILLDLNLPKVSGLEVLRQIKGDKLTGEIPVVVLTVSPADGHILECNRLGAVNYIIKPVDFENFHLITPVLDMQWALLRPGAHRPAAATPPPETDQPGRPGKEPDAER